MPLARPPAVPRLVTAGLPAILLGLACAGGDAMDAGEGPVRDTLPDGTPVVRYPRLEAPEEADLVTPELSIGALEGEGPDVFGDVRGVEAGPDGEIYVLDYAAAQVRVFSADGVHLRTLSRRGQGPGELGGSNGMVLAGDTLFVYDHSKWVMMGLDRTTGDERVRYPTPVLSYGYVWTGARDDRGRFWKEAMHFDQPSVYPPEPGLQEGAFQAFMKVYDPATATVDSVGLGEQSYRSWRWETGRGSYRGRALPFERAVSTVVDPAGGFWQVSTGAYRLARLSPTGDTTLVVEAPMEPRPVTDAERATMIDNAAERSAADRRATEAMLDHASGTHPVVASLLLAPGGRLWVERTRPDGEPRLFDLFDREGTHLGSLRLGFPASPHHRPVVRGGHLYAVVLDELGVASVVRAALPAWAVADR